MAFDLGSFLTDVLRSRFPHMQTPEEYQSLLGAAMGNQQPEQVNVTGAVPGLPSADQNAPGAGMDVGQRQSAGLYDQGPSGTPGEIPGLDKFGGILKSLPPQVGTQFLLSQVNQAVSPEQQQRTAALASRAKIAEMLSGVLNKPTDFAPVNMSPQLVGEGVTGTRTIPNMPAPDTMPAAPTGLQGFDYGGKVTPPSSGLSPDLLRSLAIKAYTGGGNPSDVTALMNIGKGEQFDLAKGTKRYDQSGNVIAANDEPPTFSEAPRRGVNPATGKPEQYVVSKDGNPKWLGYDEAANPNQPFNPDGSPNTAFQTYERTKATAGKEPGVAFDNPALVEIDDGQGGTKQITAQQNKTTGQWVTADESRTPLNATNLRVVTSSLPGGGRIAGQVIRITTAAHDIASELENISKLPGGASSGLFRDKGLAGTPLGALARTVTSQEVQSYKTSSVGINRALAALEAAGLAPPGSLTNQMEGLQLQLGDTDLTKMQKMATVRQQAGNSIDAILASPLLSKQQREEVTALKARMEKAIPWTPLDVINLLNSRNPRATLGDVAKQQGLGGQDAAATTKTINGVTYHKVNGQWMQ